MTKVNLAWLFDIDGVITNLQKKRVTEPKILDEIVKRLEKDEPVALVTGRSNSWIIRQVIEPLTSKITDKELLNNFLSVGEKGAALVVFENGNLKASTDKSFTIPKDLEQEIKNLISAQFSKWMFLDGTKETMISVEMKDNLRIPDFTPYQHRMDEILEDLLREHQLEEKYKLVSSRIATDIQNTKVGKDYAAEKVLEWLHNKQISPKKFICFGDSMQDVEMAEFIYKEGLPVEFVFVGEEHLIQPEDYPFPVVLTKEPCEKGTLEYLTAHT